MDSKIRLLWAATMMLTIAAGAAHGRTINTSNADGNEGSQQCTNNGPDIPPTCPPPPPPVFSAGCETSFVGNPKDFDCSDYGQEARPTLASAQATLALFKNGYFSPPLAEQSFRTPNFGVLDALMGEGSSSNSAFDAVFDGITRQGRIKLLQRLDGEFMVGLGGRQAIDTPWGAYFFFSTSQLNPAGTEIAFTVPEYLAGFTGFRLTEVTIFTPTQWVPEPGGLLLAGTAVAALLAVNRRRRPAPGSAGGAAPAAESAAAPPRR